MSTRKISSALISVFYKDNLAPIVHQLAKQGVEFISTGGTQEFIEKLGYAVTPVRKADRISFNFWRKGKNTTSCQSLEEYFTVVTIQQT